MDKQEALAAIDGLTFADCTNFFNERASERDKQIQELGCSSRAIDNDGRTENDHAIISEGDDNGAYLLTWTWVSFEGTDLDKEKDEKDEKDEGDEEEAAEA